MTNVVINRIWVTFTVSLISFISFSSQIFIVWPWYGRELSVDLLKLLVPFNALIFMVFWNYRLCVKTPPGGVPPGWKPNMASLEGMEVKKGTHGPRYCKTCEAYKPPRAHHCRQCKTCVLKLDHHCPWIANCVGYHNQAHFLRFLISVNLATSYHLAILADRVFEFSRPTATEPSLTDVLFMIFNFATCVPVWIAVGCFSLYHLYLASGNSTTIEGWEKDKVATLVRRGKIAEVKYPYHLGVYKNLQSVLGPNPLLWLWPRKMHGDGLSFPVNADAAEANADAQYFWPPRDPTHLPNPSRMPSGSAFTYGNESLNPSLRPTRRRHANRAIDAEHDSSGDERAADGDDSLNPLTMMYGKRKSDNQGRGTDDSRSASSSPEPYMSDFDDDDELQGRVRQGSEGWEVRPSVSAWNDPLLNARMEELRRPWEREGRYNVYDVDGTVAARTWDDGDDDDDSA